MYLKRIDIHGFKSFADKTSLEFKPGITLVVGPNGSGKSNIADAIRWVLGEQSVKSLRGGKMEDVIFAGSEKRKSLGMAEVCLTIDNSSGIFPLEFHEITVTRRLYRSGESDYLINRVPCRLRDIHELFMDTGVGREGISIIGQGKVDEILSVKPEERRGLIEEAAGIVKYRYRKKEAVKKLEDTETSLLRLHDLVSELEVQKEPLAEQARTAKIYKELKTELDSLEISLLAEEMSFAQRRLKNTEKNWEELEQELEELKAKLLKTQSLEEEQKLLLQKKDESIALQQENIYNATLQLEKNDNEIKLLAERVADLAKQRKNYNQEILRLQEEIDSLGKEIAVHQEKGEALQKNLQASQDRLKEYEKFLAQDLLEDQNLAGRLEQLKSEHFESLQEETRLNNTLHTLKQRLILLERQEEQIKSKEIKHSQDLGNVTGKIQDLEQQALEYKTVLQTLEQQVGDNESKTRLAESEYQGLQNKYHNLQAEQNSLLTRLKLVREMEREGQGYAYGVREILRQKELGNLTGIIGTVAQVISTPKEYEIAVEVALGAALQHVITENDRAAQKAVEWLKKHEKGRVTFLPLNTVNGKKSSENMPVNKGVLGRLGELIHYDRRYEGIIEYLLGRVWLVDNLSTALVVARETGYRLRIVTLDGQLINIGGSITGGSIKANSSGILSRKRDQKELEAAVKEIESTLETVRKELTTKGDYLAKLKENTLALKEELLKVNIGKAENVKTLERWKAEQERYKIELETVGWQLAEITNEKNSIIAELEKAENDLSTLKKGIGKIHEVLETLQHNLKIKQTERLKKNEKLTQMRIEVATAEEKITAHQKENNYLLQRLRQLENYRADKEKAIAEIKEIRNQMEQNSRQLAQEKERLMLSIRQQEEKLEQSRSERRIIQEEIERLYQETKDLNNLLKDKEDKLHQHEIQRSKFETTLEALTNRLYEQYGLSLEEAKARSIAISDKRSAQMRIGELKDKIAELGEVNLAAIEEFKRLTERLEFLSIQITDMREAKERLQTVIKEMDAIMTKKFKETYILVDAAFQEMFTRLFGGGRAQLQLTQTENLLEAGVEIIAQPPGKKTQYLSLLSGGEKALTAIALLMAVLKVKPSPFCVLDEIESNLDEANVNNFAKLLKEFSAQSQFIVISHHKGTMEIADVLYGVTIEETGVSRLVSVKLEEAKKAAS